MIHEYFWLAYSCVNMAHLSYIKKDAINHVKTTCITIHADPRYSDLIRICAQYEYALKVAATADSFDVCSAI